MQKANNMFVNYVLDTVTHMSTLANLVIFRKEEEIEVKLSDSMYTLSNKNPSA